jgi:hypothetical protein
VEEIETPPLEGRRKTGRPRKSPEKLRIHAVKVRFSSAELAFVRDRAAGRPLADVVRDLALGSRHETAYKVPAANREVVKAIWKYTRELQVLVRSVGAGQSSLLLEPLFEEHLRAIASYQHALLNGTAE